MNMMYAGVMNVEGATMKTTNLDTPLQQFERLVRANINESEFKNADREYLSTEIIDFAKQLIREQRLIELDLLEQAINQGRDMNKYKMMRLEALTDSNKEDKK